MIKIAVQGEKSTFSDIAAIKYFGKNILFSPSFNINKVFEKVRHLNHLSKLYTGKSPYFGELLPKELEKTEFPVMCKILPQEITTLPLISEEELKNGK